ncbi:MAG: hypothetical protein QM704_21540 [Anaeromyxobacteraceae bacterium]
MEFWDEIYDEIRRDLEPANMLQGSQDFLGAWNVLQRHRQAPAVVAGQERFPIQATASCASMALELALKCRVRLEGTTPPKTHRFSALIAAMSPAAQDALAAAVRIDDRQVDAGGLLQALVECDKTFETWRYLHEHDNADFFEPRLIDTTRALHAIILKANPNWQPAGVVPTHLVHEP